MVVDTARSVASAVGVEDSGDDVWTDVRLLGVNDGPQAHGRVIHGHPDLVGVRVPVGMARLLHAEPVWASVRTRQGRLHVLRGRAVRRQDARDVLELHDLEHLATESRRDHLRSAMEHAVLLVRYGTRMRRTTTSDLSASGCLIRPLPEPGISPGQRVRAALALDTARDPASFVWAETEVSRVERATGHIALRFIEVEPADRDRLDRHVLGSLTPA